MDEAERTFKAWLSEHYEDDPPADIGLKLRAAFLAGWRRPKYPPPKLAFTMCYSRCVPDYVDYKIKEWMTKFGLDVFSTEIEVTVQEETTR